MFRGSYYQAVPYYSTFVVEFNGGKTKQAQTSAKCSTLYVAHMRILCNRLITSKQPNLKLKTLPKQRLGPLPFVLTCLII